MIKQSPSKPTQVPNKTQTVKSKKKVIRIKKGIHWNAQRKKRGAGEPTFADPKITSIDTPRNHQSLFEVNQIYPLQHSIQHTKTQQKISEYTFSIVLSTLQANQAHKAIITNTTTTNKLAN